MSGPNGNGNRTQMAVNILLGILIGVLGYVWREQANDFRDTKRQVVETAKDQAVLRNDMEFVKDILIEIRKDVREFSKEEPSRRGGK
jgi:hypothetical protein